MGTLFISEYGGASGRDPLAREPEITVQTLTFSSTGSTASTAFNAATTLVRISSDALCHIKIAATPVAGSTDKRMAADSPEYFGVPPSGSFKVAAIST